jgi:hypothetical protein
MLVPWFIILAAAGQVKSGAWRAPVLWTTLALVAALLIGALVIAVVDRWRKRSASDRLTPGQQLSQFRALYDKGEISREEFERIRALLGEQLREELQMPGAKRPDAAPTAAPTTGIQALDDRLQPPPPGPAPTGPEVPPPPPNGPESTPPAAGG